MTVVESSFAGTERESTLIESTSVPILFVVGLINVSTDVIIEFGLTVNVSTPTLRVSLEIVVVLAGIFNVSEGISNESFRIVKLSAGGTT